METSLGRELRPRRKTRQSTSGPHSPWLITFGSSVPHNILFTAESRKYLHLFAYNYDLLIEATKSIITSIFS